MLANYDAKAVADVMGIAFLRDRQGGPDRSAMVSGRSGPATGARAERFVIDFDDGAARMVELRVNNRYARFETSLAGADRSFASGTDAMWSPSPMLIEKAVQKGLPRLALRRVAERLAGGDATKISALEWVVVPKTSLERRQEQLSPQESERTERVARLFVHARHALGSEAEARAFMTTPHPQLDGRSPIDAARTDLGTRRTEQILNALEYGLAL